MNKLASMTDWAIPVLWVSSVSSLLPCNWPITLVIMLPSKSWWCILSHIFVKIWNLEILFHMHIRYYLTGNFTSFWTCTTCHADNDAQTRYMQNSRRKHNLDATCQSKCVQMLWGFSVVKRVEWLKVSVYWIHLPTPIQLSMQTHFANNPYQSNSPWRRPICYPLSLGASVRYRHHPSHCDICRSAPVNDHHSIDIEVAVTFDMCGGGFLSSFSHCISTSSVFVCAVIKK